MNRFFIKKGMRCVRGEQILTLLRRLVDKRLQFEAEDGEIWIAKEAELMALLAKNTIRIDLDSATKQPVLQASVISRDLSSYPEEVREQAKRRLAYVQGLETRGVRTSSPNTLLPAIQDIASAIGDKAPPSASSLNRWVSRFKRGGSILSLIDKKEQSGRRRGLGPEVQAGLDEAIDTVYLNPQRYPKQKVYDYLLAYLHRLGKAYLVPSKASIYRWLKDLDCADVAIAREGKLAGDRRFRSVIGIQRALRILERVEIDHTPIDVLVYCAISKLPIGRPYLTIALDKYSRMIVGYYISFSNPSAYAVLQCIRQIILPKDPLLVPYPDITTPWPARGIPMTIVCDNGMELHSRALSEACLELGIQLQFCPAKLPEYKGSVERFFRTINQGLIHYLPGTVFSNPKERNGYESEKLAAISFDTLNHLVLKWITEVYHQTPHRGIAMDTPLKRWQDGEQEVLIPFPTEPAQLDIILGHAAERPVHHYGVEINNLRYNNPELQQLRRRHGEELRVDLKYHQDDLGKIHVFDADRKEYFSVPAIDQEYAAGLRMEIHEIIKAKGRYKANDPQHNLDLIHKKQELQELVDRSVTEKKMAKRKRASAMKGINTSQSNIREQNSISSYIPPLGMLLEEDSPLPKLTVRPRSCRASGDEYVA